MGSIRTCITMFRTVKILVTSVQKHVIYNFVTHQQNIVINISKIQHRHKIK